MTCPRCRGLMWPYIIYSEADCQRLETVRCLNCGECTDDVIQQNRQVQQEQGVVEP